MCKKIMAMLLAGLFFLTGISNTVMANETDTERITTIVVADLRYLEEAPVGYYEVEGIDGKNLLYGRVGGQIPYLQGSSDLSGVCVF